METPTPQYDIFISYRRTGGADFARNMQLKLQNYGFRVFLDYDELKDGKFDRRIMDAIESAPVFLMILSPNSLDRCSSERDWVRREIEYAIEHDRHIVPVNPDRTFTDFPEDCPESVREGLGQHQFTEIFSGQQFTTTVDDMVRVRIRPVLAASAPRQQEEVGAIIHLETDMDCRVLKFGKEITVARVGEDTVIRLRKGKHKLEFVSTENEADRYALVFPVEDNEMEDFLQVELAAERKKRLESTRKEADTARKEQEHETREAARKADAARKTREEADQRFLAELQRRKQEDAAKRESEEKTIQKRAEEEIREGENLPKMVRDPQKINDQEIESFVVSGKKGFRVKSTGDVLVLPKYNWVWPFKEGLARVNLAAKYGFVDKFGREVVPLKYTSASDFSEGMAVVSVNDKAGYVDTSGKEVIPLKYCVATSFCNGRAHVGLTWSDKDRYDIDKKGNRLDAEEEKTQGSPNRNDLCPCGSGKKYKNCHGQGL